MCDVRLVPAQDNSSVEYLEVGGLTHQPVRSCWVIALPSAKSSHLTHSYRILGVSLYVADSSVL